jgi:hypothetical protein
MTNSDLAVGVVGLPNVGALLKKPTYLVTLTEGEGKNRKEVFFLSIDRPELVAGGFIQTKGAFVDSAEVTDVVKDAVAEMIFPSHRLVSIKNLVFKQK